MSESGGPSGSRPIYSIGALSRMVGVETATVRAWEERYGVVVPARSAGGQRIYSRDQLEQMRFLVEMVAGGATPGDAHRVLFERVAEGARLTAADARGATIVILLAERDRYAAELVEYLLRTEGYEVCVAMDPRIAEQLFAECQPELAIVELMISGGGLDLCARLAAESTAPVLAMSAVDLSDAALGAGASAFLGKPIVPLQFVSTVRDLLGSSALTRPSS